MIEPEILKILSVAKNITEARHLIGRKLTDDERAMITKLAVKRRLERQRGGDRKRERKSAEARERAADVRCIGSIPAVKDIDRRKSCERDLAKFITTYSGVGLSPFSKDHLRVIERIQNSIWHGGRFVEAVYRGFGKTTISNISVLWAVAYGHCRCVLLIRANATMADAALDAIKGMLAGGSFAEDFPEICYPVISLEGVAQRAKTQQYIDKRGEVKDTKLGWAGVEINLPFTDGAPDGRGGWQEAQAAGAVIVCAGITSSTIRGYQHRRADGHVLRPDFALIDDPQDDESAQSATSCTKRLEIIHKGIIRGAGHTRGLSIVMPCTVIQRDDMIDQLLDKKKFPAWQGERIPFVTSWAELHDEMWMSQYSQILTEYDADDPDDFFQARKRATAFYQAHREDMDKGAAVSWDHAFDPTSHEVSAIQHAYNALIYDGAIAFATEFQNQPLEAPEEEGQLTVGAILPRINKGMIRGQPPENCESLTAFIDVQKNCLFWMVCGWQKNFNGWVIDYGCYPPQPLNSFTLRDLKYTIFHRHKATSQEGAWRSAIDTLTEQLLTTDYAKITGGPLRISRMMIDANDGNAAQTVFDACRASAHAAILLPACGRAVSAAQTPFSEYKQKPGEQVSPYNWRIPTTRGKRTARYILADVNWWKSFTRARLLTFSNDVGCLEIFGREKNTSETPHGMLLQHLTSEFSVRTVGRGRTVDEWKLRPNMENHYWDCLIGCMIGASNMGCVLGVSDQQIAGIAKNRKSREERLAMLGRVIK